MKSRVITLLMVAMLVMSMTACSKTKTATTDTATTEVATTDATTTVATNDTSTAEPVSLKLYWWGSQKRNDVTQQVVELYMQQNPNVKVDIEFTDWSGYWDKLASMAAGGNLPDIVQMDYSYLAQYQKSNQLADLTSFISDGTIDTTKINASIIGSGTIDTKTYAIALGTNAPVMIYDKAIVAEAGVEIPAQPTIEQLYEIGNTIFEKTGVSTYFDGEINMMTMMARTQSSHLFDELSSGTGNTMAKQFGYVDWFNQAPSAIPADILAEKNPLQIETKPIIDSTTWNDFSFSNQFSSIVTTAGRELDLCMWPTTADATSQPMYLKPSMFFAVSETSQNKAEAAKFLNWFTNSEEANLILMAERGVPINSDIAEAVKAKVDPVTAKVFDFMAEVSKIAEPLDAPDPAGKGEVEAAVTTTVADLRYGDITAEEATAQFVPQAKTILEKAAK